MPAATGIGIAVSALFTAGSAIYASKKSSSSSRAATAAESDAIDKQLVYEREQEAVRKAEHDREQAEAKSQWEAEQAKLDEDRAYLRQRDADEIARKNRTDERDYGLAREKFDTRERTMAPYRAAGAGALSQLARLAGIEGAVTPAVPTMAAVMPEGWTKPTEATAPVPGADRNSLITDDRLVGPTATPRMTTIQETRPAALETTAPSSVRGEVSIEGARPLAAAPESKLVRLTPEQIVALSRTNNRRSMADLGRKKAIA